MEEPSSLHGCLWVCFEGQILRRFVFKWVFSILKVKVFIRGPPARSKAGELIRHHILIPSAVRQVHVLVWVTRMVVQLVRAPACVCVYMWARVFKVWMCVLACVCVYVYAYVCVVCFLQCTIHVRAYQVAGLHTIPSHTHTHTRKRTWMPPWSTQWCWW